MPILGVPVDPLNADEARRALRSAVGDPWDGRCRHVVTLNPEYVMAARRDPLFASLIGDADVITADGVGVAIATRLLHPSQARGIERLTGVELLDWLAAESGPANAPIFLLGAGPGVAADATAAIERRYPDARIAGWWSEGSSRIEDDDRALDRIARSGARVLAVAYGAPGQVLWIARNQDRLAAAGVRVAIGVGGTLDYLAGRVSRAPALVRKLGLEWLYRLVREPWRWRRQLVLPVFTVRVLIDWIWRRGNRPAKHAKLKELPDRRQAETTRPPSAGQAQQPVPETAETPPAPRSSN